jgi:hypothetical protein
MKNRSSKTILVFFALGLISCAFCVQQAQAVQMNGIITIAGGAQLADALGNPVTSVNDATQVTGWLDEGGFLPTVQSVSGSMAAFVSVGASVTFTPSWSFVSGAITAFWSVGGFTFNLIASNIIYQANGFVAVYGTGTVTGHGFNAPGNWSFTAQDDPANGVFSFSASSLVPDGGATVALLGLALAGIEGIRRKFMRAKS